MDDLLEALARYDSPTLANAIETFDIQPRDVGFADSRIRCMFPELGRMVGFAATATIVARGGPGSDWAGAGNDGLYAHARTIRRPADRGREGPRRSARARLAVGRGSRDDLRRRSGAWAASPTARCET